jgi:hypothetical protein
LSKSLQRRSATAKSIVWHSEICAIQDIETFGQQLQVYPFSNSEPSTQTQIERSEVKPASRISSDAGRSIVVVCIEVTITSQQHVERQTRSVREDVTKLKALQRPLETAAFRLLRRLERTTNNQAVSLIVVRQAPIVSNVETILNTREEKVAGVIDRLRKRI